MVSAGRFDVGEIDADEALDMVAVVLGHAQGEFVLAADPGAAHFGYASWTGDEEAEDRIELVIEEFVLYPHFKHSAFQPMETSEQIGALKLLARQANVSVVEQGAFIKKPMRRQLKARGIKQVGSGTHARDAELHLYYRMLKEWQWSSSPSL